MENPEKELLDDYERMCWILVVEKLEKVKESGIIVLYDENQEPRSVLFYGIRAKELIQDLNTL